MTSPRNRYYPLSVHLKRRFGRRVRKIPLDAGFDCPNRDGTISRAGCAFCNPRGSGTGLHDRGMDIAAQWAMLTERIGKKYRADLFLAYFQSFTNTHCAARELAALLDTLRGLPGLAGMALGTRPDCLDLEKARLLAAMPFEENWLDLGLQSAHDRTLERINRGHTARCFAEAAELAAGQGLKVCAHVIHGLPGEGNEDFMATMRFVAALPVAGIKFHNLYVCEGTALARDFRAGGYQPPSMADYAESVARGLALLPSRVVVHRLNGDAAPGELVAPDWASDKAGVRNSILNRLREMDLWQGAHADAPSEIPKHFNHDPDQGEGR